MSTTTQDRFNCDPNDPCDPAHTMTEGEARIDEVLSGTALLCTECDCVLVSLAAREADDG